MTLLGWTVAVLLLVAVLRLRRRLELVACAEHELRGPLTAFALGVEAARRGVPLADRLDAELERARVALADLTEARRGRRARPGGTPVNLEGLVRSSAAAWGVPVRWDGGATCVVATNPGRVAQALGNVLANAAEHGDGEVLLAATRRGDSRVDLVAVNGTRGRGLRIAAAAAREARGRLSTEERDGEFRATLELPVVP